MKAEWSLKSLGEVCTLQRGFDLPTRDRIAGAYPLVSSSGITGSHATAPVVGPGVVTGRSGSRGNVFFIEDDFWPLNTVLYIKDFQGNEPRFVYHLLHQLDLKQFAGGTGVPTLNRNNVHVAKVFVPESQVEQQRIVAILDEAFDGIATAKANAQKNLQNARELFDAHVEALFSAGGDDWVEKKLSEICEKITDGTHQTPTYFESGYVFLSSRNVKSGTIDWENIKYIDELQHVAMQKRAAPKLGDVLLAKNGTTRVAANVDRDIEFDIYVSVALLRPLKGILPAYLLQFVNSSIRQSQSGNSTNGLRVPVYRICTWKKFARS